MVRKLNIRINNWKERIEGKKLEIYNERNK